MRIPLKLVGSTLTRGVLSNAIPVAGPLAGFAFELFVNGFKEAKKAELKTEGSDYNTANDFYKPPIIQVVPNDVDYKKIEDMILIPHKMVKEKYPETKNVSLGYFTNHPINPDMLTPIEHYHKNLALEKDDELVVLLGKLGAERVLILENCEEGKESETGATANLDTLKCKGGSSFSLNKVDLDGKALMVVYEGFETSFTDSLLEDSLWFKNDSTLNSILEMRKNKQNKIVKYELVNKYNSTFGFNFNFDLKLPNMPKGSLYSEYSSIKDKSRRFLVEFKPRKKFNW